MTHSGHFSADKTLWVNPEKIAYSSLKEFDIYRDKGAVIGGDWDRLEKRFTALLLFEFLVVLSHF